MNLIGAPFQIIIGKQTEGDLIEFKETGQDSKKLKLAEVIKLIKEEKIKLISSLEKEITLRFLKARKKMAF